MTLFEFSFINEFRLRDLFCYVWNFSQRFLLGPRFSCDTCGRRYRGMNGLHQHQKYECQKEPTFVCPQSGCCFKFKLKSNLTRHLRNKHNYKPV